jgi:hypothetical protein
MHDPDFLFLEIFCVAVKAPREKTSFIRTAEYLRFWPSTLMHGPRFITKVK